MTVSYNGDVSYEISGDMFKGTYDSDDSGIVDSAESVDGVATAGNSKYYGTDGAGTAGFHAVPDISDLMDKTTYDTNSDGTVDSADSSAAIDGVATAGNDQYYGTNASGTPGFYDRKTITGTDPTQTFTETTNNTDATISLDSTGSLTISADANNEQASSALIIKVDGSEKVRISPNGLSFNGDTAAVNCINDRERGTASIELADAITGGNTATGSIIATYSKIDDDVTLFINCSSINTTGMTAGNNLYVRNLPFAVDASAATGSVQVAFYNWTPAATGRAAYAYPSLSSTRINIRECLDSGSTSAVTVGQLTSGTAGLTMQITYKSA